LIVIIKIYQTHQERGSYHISYHISNLYMGDVFKIRGMLEYYIY